MLPNPPAQMVYDIAAGMEEPLDIAIRYGYLPSEWKVLEENQPFRQAVAAARSELEKGGHAVRTKARWMTEVLLEDLFFRMKQDGVSVGQLQETIRITSRLGDLEPKSGPQLGAGGPTTSVQIVFSGTAQPAVTIGPQGLDQKEKEPLTFDIEVPDADH